MRKRCSIRIWSLESAISKLLYERKSLLRSACSKRLLCSTPKRIGRTWYRYFISILYGTILLLLIMARTFYKTTGIKLVSLIDPLGCYDECSITNSYVTNLSRLTYTLRWSGNQRRYKDIGDRLIVS
jgi:hypothetical protein